MVYSATSASATLENGDPAYYVKRQAIYAALGLVLMFLFARFRFQALRRLAPLLVATSLGLLAAVLVLGSAVNGARRWISFGPAVFQPSELAKIALAVWAASYLSRRRPPMTLKELWRPVGALACVFAGLLILEPDLGTTIAIFVMLAGMLLVAGTPVRVLGAGLSIATALGVAAIWFEPYRRARLFSFINPWHDAQGAGPGDDRPRLGRHLRPRARPEHRKGELPPRGTHGHDLRDHRRGAGAGGRRRIDRRVRDLRLRRPPHRAALPRPLRQGARDRAHDPRLRPGRDQHRRRDGAGAVDGNSAPVRLLRRLEPDRRARVGGDPP